MKRSPTTAVPEVMKKAKSANLDVAAAKGSVPPAASAKPDPIDVEPLYVFLFCACLLPRNTFDKFENENRQQLQFILEELQRGLSALSQQKQRLGRENTVENFKGALEEITKVLKALDAGSDFDLEAIIKLVSKADVNAYCEKLTAIMSEETSDGPLEARPRQKAGTRQWGSWQLAATTLSSVATLAVLIKDLCGLCRANAPPPAPMLSPSVQAPAETPSPTTPPAIVINNYGRMVTHLTEKDKQTALNLFKSQRK